MAEEAIEERKVYWANWYDAQCREMVGKRFGFMWRKKITNFAEALHWREHIMKRPRFSQIQNGGGHVNQTATKLITLCDLAGPKGYIWLDWYDAEFLRRYAK